MSNFRTFTWKSGGLVNSSLTAFWSPTRTAKDPSIPTLPLEASSDLPPKSLLINNPAVARAAFG